MTNVDALKNLAAAIMEDSVSVDEIPGETSADVINYIAKFKRGEFLGQLRVSSVAGKTTGTTTITVSPTITGGNSYVTKSSPNKMTEPEYLDVATDWDTWDGTSDIAAEDGHYLAVAEVNSDNEILKFGQVVANVNLG